MWYNDANLMIEEAKKAGTSDKSLNLISDSTPGYDPQQDNYVESMMWTLDASEPMNFRVDASINMDGQVNRQYSLFEKVE